MFHITFVQTITVLCICVKMERTEDVVYGNHYIVRQLRDDL